MFKLDIEEYLRRFTILCLVATGLMLGFSLYYFISSPENFYYQSSCEGMSCSPAVGGGVTIFGMPVSDEFEIPVLSDEEFSQREKRNKTIGFTCVAVYLLIGVQYFLKKYDRKRREEREEKDQV